MAKISQLPSLDQPTGDELLVAVRGNETVRVRVSDMVAGAVAPVTGAIDDLKQDALAFIGRPGSVALVDGTPKGTGAVYWHDAVDQVGTLIGVDVFDKGPGTTKVAVYRGALAALARVGLSSIVTTGSRATRRIALAEPLEVHPGDILALQGPDGALSVAEVQSGDAGYTYSYPDLPETIALGQPTTNGQVQARFVIVYRDQVVTADRFLATEAGAALGSAAAQGIDLLSAHDVAFIGRPGDAVLVDGTPVSIGAVYWRDAVDYAGTFTSLDLFDKTAATVRVAVYRGAPNGLSRIALTSVQTNGSGSVRRLALPAPVDVLPGDIIAMQASVEGAYSVDQVQSGDAGYNYSFPDLPATIALDAPTTNGQLQVRFRINYRRQVVTTESVNALGAIKVGGARAVALSSDGKPKGYVAWKTTGLPVAHTVSWDGHTVTLGAFDQEMRFPNYSLTQPFTFVGNSLTDSTDVLNRWSQILAARYGQPFISEARYSSDWRQVYRIGAKAIELTLAGPLPAAGPVAISKVNGLPIDGDNPAAFLTTGDPYVLSGMSKSGYLKRNGVTCRATVSAPNGASFAYVVQQAPGQTEMTFDGPVTFVPDAAVSVRGTTCVVWIGNNYGFSGVPNAYGDHTNPQLWVDLKLIVAFLQAQGCRVLLLPIIPSANTDPNDNWLARGKGTPYTAMESANARTASMFPGLMARHADGRSLLEFLQSRNDGSPEALDDVAKGFTPRNLRRKDDGSYDLLHMYGAGTGDLAIADFVDSALQSQILPPAVTQSTKFVITAIGTDLHPSDVALISVTRDPIADIADSVQGALSDAAYRPTLASAVADFDVGTFFTSRDLDGETKFTGIKRQYQVTDEAPFWADRGPWSDAADVGLGRVDNTRDREKMVSEPQADAIASSTGGLARLTDYALQRRIRTDMPQDLAELEQTIARSNVGLGLVDNTRDNEKPVSSPQAAALGLRLMAISSFADAPNTPIPGGTRRVKMQNNGAEYIYDPAIDATYVALNPRASFVSSNGLGFRIDPSLPQDPLMHGAIGFSGSAFGPPPNDTAALKSLFKNCDYVDLGMKGQSWLCASPIQGRSGQHVSGKGGKIYRLDHLDHIISLIDVDGFVLSGVELSHGFAGGAIARSNKSCVYGLRSRNVKIHHAFFKDTGLFAVSSDESGPGWSVCDNDFLRIAGTCVDLRGYAADGSGKGFQVSNNYMETTGDDAIAVAYFSQAGIISHNIIFNPGQYVTYDERKDADGNWIVDGDGKRVLFQAGGGGIRFNGRQIVALNQIFNANLFFISPATYSKNLAAAPNQAMIYGNIGRGIKPTINNTAAGLLIKSVESIYGSNNDFDMVGDNVLAIQSISNNGAGFVRIVTAQPHKHYERNRVRFEIEAGVGAEGGVAAVIDDRTIDMTNGWLPAYAAATRCFPAIHGIRPYTDSVVIQSVTDNGNGKVRVTSTDAHGYTTGEDIRIAEAGGVTNGAGQANVVSPTVFDIPSLAFTGAYTSGGVSYRTAATSRAIKIRGFTLRNPEHVIAPRGGGATILDIEEIEAINFTYFFNPANNPQIAELNLNRNILRNPRTISGGIALTGALFYGGGAANAATVGKLELNKNKVIAGPFGQFNAPIDFTNMVAIRAEALGNKLGGAVNSFLAAGNIPMFLFDGDWSETMHAAGSVTIAAGQTTSAAIAHGLPRNPRLSSFSLQKTSAGSAPGGGGLYVEYPTSTGFVVRCDTAPTAPLTVTWRINPMPRPYINNATGA